MQIDNQDNLHSKCKQRWLTQFLKLDSSSLLKSRVFCAEPKWTGFIKSQRCVLVDLG